MNRLQNASPELLQLLAAACADDATREQLDALEQMVSDENAMQLLIDYMQMDGELHRLVRQQQNAEKCLAMLGFGSSLDRPLLAVEASRAAVCSPAMLGGGIFGDAWKYINSHEMLRGYVIAVPLFFAVLGLVWAFGVFSSSTCHNTLAVHDSKIDQNLDETSQQPANGNASPSKLPHSIVAVAKISERIDCQWNLVRSFSGGRSVKPRFSDSPQSQSLDSPLYLGDKLILETGLMEIAYNSGAKVILQGPCTFNVETNGGFLAVGRLTGKLEKGSGDRGQGSEERRLNSENHKSEIINQKSPAPCPLTSVPFAIATPTALVTDLGTEFGVDVDKQQGTTIRVMRGIVEATRDATNGSRPIHERLTAGQSLYIASLTDLPVRLDLAEHAARQQSKHAAANPVHVVLAPELKTSLKNIKAARDAKIVPKPIGLVATAYHHVWDKEGHLAAENSRQLAFEVATDDIFGRGVAGETPRSSFDTAVVSGEASEERKLPVRKVKTEHQQRADAPRSPLHSEISGSSLSTAHCSPSTVFVGLRYDRPIRFDRIKIFLAKQERDGGNWAETPRVFILKNPVDTDSTPPENEPGNWRELTAQYFYGDSNKIKPASGPGMVIEIPLTGSSPSDRTGYGWAVGGVKGNGTRGYVSITELRAYTKSSADEQKENNARNTNFR